MHKDPRNTYFNSIAEFKFIECKKIGKGSFGEVRLALHIETSKTYAIKIVKQQEIDTEVGRQALEREVELHVGIDHPHIVRLWSVFKEEDTVYMVMDYIEKGNLFYYQNEKKVFSEDQSSVFFSQTLSAIDYLHSLNLMHRDLKPQNLLLDSNYDIKICDFGWIIEGINEKHSTFCGTYEYMAPEMIFGNKYDYKIDIWALGILLYELLHGFAPFQGQTLEEVKNTMMKGDIHIDPTLSENAQNLIFNILKVLPEERLTAKEIRDHPWMKDMKMRRIQELTLKVKNRKSERTLKKQGSIPNSLILKNKDEQEQACKMSIAKKEHKRQVNLKNYMSSQNLKTGKKQKHRTSEKQNFMRLLKKNSNIQRLLKTHHHQTSDFSQISKKPKRLITEASGERTIKNDKVIRFNTEISQGFDLSCYKSSSAKKKKTMPKKNILTVTSNFLKSSCKTKINRKSID